MDRFLILSPFILLIVGYNTSLVSTRISAGLFTAFLIIFYPSHIVVIAVLLALCLTVLFLENFYRRLNRTRRAFNEKLTVMVDELAVVKKDSETTKLNLKRVEKSIKNILHIYELVKNIASYIEFEKMFSLIAQSLDEQFSIKNVKLEIADENRIFQKGLLTDDIMRFPLFIDEKLLATVSIKIPPLFHKDKEFIDDITAFVEELKSAVQRAILYSKIESLSRTDGLTGLYRRGYFNQRLKDEELRTKRSNSRFSILMMDIDHFKKINDTYGHQAGDMVLKTVTTILKENIYETDFAARYGGEEFVVIFPQTDPAGIKIKTEKIRQKIQATDIILELEKVKVTASFGIAHYPKDGSTAEQALHNADIALYRSKQTGRNKVTEFSDEQN